jgi:hypothetical protein
MEPHENRILDEQNPDDIIATLTISQVQTDTASLEDEAELAQIWQHEAKLNQISFRERKILDGAQESNSVISATMPL